MRLAPGLRCRSYKSMRTAEAEAEDFLSVIVPTARREGIHWVVVPTSDGRWSPVFVIVRQDLMFMAPRIATHGWLVAN